MPIELRVHGVSGTPPEELLRLPAERIERVAGDDDAGFYRPKPAAEIPLHDQQLEAYSWGKLTSGPALRAFWLLLTPFILVNVAHWMLPPISPQSHRAAWSGRMSVRLLRLIGLSLTLTLMLTAALTVMDITAWQCGALGYCSTPLGPATFLHRLTPGCLMVAGALPVAGLIGGILYIGRARRGVPDQPPPDAAVLGGDVPLTHERFWEPDTSVIRLRACHVMAWSAGLAALTLAAPVRYSAAGPVGAGLLAANATLLATAVAGTAISRVTGRGGPGADGLTGPLRYGEWLSVLLLAGSLLWVVFTPASYPPAPTHLPGLRGAIYVLLAIQVLLFAGLFATTACSRVTTFAAGFRPMLRGFAAPITAIIAWLVGGAFSTGLVLLAAVSLGTPVASTRAATRADLARKTLPADGADAPLIVPPPLFWAAIVFIVVLILLVLAVVTLRSAVVRHRAKACRAAVLGEHRADTSAAAQQRATAVARAQASASVTGRLIALIGTVAVLAAVLIVTLAAVYWRLGFQSLPDRFPNLTKVAVAFIATAAGFLVVVTFWALRNRRVRRTVAILWDVTTFWPRANHPLTPPCYGERAVPQLLRRVRTLADEGSDTVVLAAHSQGSIIGAAAILQAGPTAPARVALLTFGSPLRRLYARNFPAYFGFDALRALRLRLPRRWINMWAHSDPIGSWVLDSRDSDPADLSAALDAVDLRLLDVTSLQPIGDDSYPPICRHSGFWTRPEYHSCVSALNSVISHPDQT